MAPAKLMPQISLAYLSRVSVELAGTNAQ